MGQTIDIFARARGFAARAMAMLLTAAALLPSCRNAIYDGEGDCEATYRLRFRYDRNLKWADAFANEVKSVAVFAYDTAGALAWSKSESGAALAGEEYAMALDLPAGKYRIVAWCGLEDGSFALTETDSCARMQCSLARSRDDDGTAYSGSRLAPLFHGTIEAELPDGGETGGVYEYTIPLAKNTNHVRVVLQHLSGADVEADDFRFSIEDDNGLMRWDNELLPDETVRYREWNRFSAAAGVGYAEDAGDGATAKGSRTVTEVRAAMADLTVARMTAGHARRMMLAIVREADGETVARIPVIDYALLVKEYYETEYGHEMDDQEFLDREDEYVLTFFLDEKDNWISSTVLINSWRVVPQDTEM